MDNVNYRIAKEDDLKELSELYVKVYMEANEKEKWEVESAYSLLKTLYDFASKCFVVATIEGKIIGAFAGMLKPWWNGMHLVETELFVDKKYRGLGISKKLQLELAIKAKENYDVKYIEGVTFTDRDFPLSFYKRIGYEEDTQLVPVCADVDILIHNLM